MSAFAAAHLLGIGDAPAVPADPRSIAEIVLEAVEAALADAGRGWDEIDAVTSASVDLFDGLTASNIAVTEVTGAVMKPEARIAGDGLAAALHAVCQIRAGAYRTVLVVAHAKASMADHDALSRWAMDPIWLQPLGVDFLACSALQAQLLASRDPGCEQRWAELAFARRGARASSFAAPSSVEAVLASPLLASPLREGMRAPLGDGACALLLGVESQGARTPRIAGLGWDLDAHAPGARDLARWDGLARALARAQASCGAGAGQGIDLAEPSCLFPHEEELFRAAAGLAAATEVSPDGGLFPGTAPVVAGLSRLAAAARRMRADPECRRALAHGSWGPAGQAHAVALLEAA